MYIETFARSIAVLAIGLPALAQSALSGDAQSAGGGLVSTYPGGTGTCVLLAGPVLAADRRTAVQGHGISRITAKAQDVEQANLEKDPR